jgi:hypothetical protein
VRIPRQNRNAVTRRDALTRKTVRKCVADAIEFRVRPFHDTTSYRWFVSISLRRTAQ